MRRLIKQQSPDAIRGAIVRMMDRPDSTSIVAALRVPALIVVGAEDELTPVEESRSWPRPFPDARLEIIPGAGHLANLEQPEPFNAALVSFSLHSHEISAHWPSLVACISSPASRPRIHRRRRSMPLHRAFDKILDIYVRDGLVYYRALKQERAKFDRYVASLGGRDSCRRSPTATSNSRSGSTPTTRSCCGR